MAKAKTKSRRRSGIGSSADARALLRNQPLPWPFVVGSLVVIVACVTDLSALNEQTGRIDIEAETVASQTVRAAFPLEAEDLDATRDSRDVAAAQVPEAYSVDLERVNNQLLTLNQRINTLTERREAVAEALRNALLNSNSLQHREEIITQAIDQLASQWREEPLLEGFPEASVLAVWLTPRLDSVPRREFAEDVAGDPNAPRQVKQLGEAPEGGLQYAYINELTALARDGLDFTLTMGVLQRPNARPGTGAESVRRVQILRGRVVGNLVGDLAVSEERPLSEIPDLTAARSILRTRIAKEAKELEATRGDAAAQWERLQNAAFEMAALGITDTLVPNQVVTEGNRMRARNAVEPVMKTIDANQIIQQEGYRWTRQSRSDAQTYWDKIESGRAPSRNVFAPIAANALLVLLILVALIRAVPVLATRNTNAAKAVNVALLIMSATVVLGRIMSFIEPSGLVVPCVASAILLAILTNTRIAILGGVLMATLISIQYGNNWQLLIVMSAMSFAGVSTLFMVRRRSDMTRAALTAAAAGLLMHAAIVLSAPTVLEWASVRQGGLIALNGAMCLFLVPGLLPPLERLFRITTDIQLLEYSDLNNELLSRLAIEIPATYAHSLMLGQLAEAAADAIGANGLMARVCAYYHDIGKLRRPEYFSENQMGHNIHDELSPRLSARAIASHVTDGIELAKEFHLPEPIIRGIREHHGTNLISFFYDQALAQQKHGDVREEDYRYPGPKPQSRETAILMICDGVESGVRSIKNPNAERIQEFVDRIIQSRAEDRQFDECDLTLRDLDVIGEKVAHRIMSAHHTRIAYPQKSAPAAKNVIPISGTRES